MLYNFLKTSKKAFGVVFSVFVIFMLTSCENSFGHNSEGTDNQNVKTYLSINVSEFYGRNWLWKLSSSVIFLW